MALQDTNGAANWVQRTLNLTGNTQVEMTYSYSTTGLSGGPGENVQLQVSTDGVTFTTLVTHDSTAALGHDTYRVDLSAYISATTTIRLLAPATPHQSTLSQFDDFVIRATPSKDYATTAFAGGAAVAIASSNVSIIDGDSANLSSATITLTNHQAGDALAAMSALPGGITASVLQLRHRRADAFRLGEPAPTTPPRSQRSASRRRKW